MADKRNKGRDISATCVEGDWLSKLAQEFDIKPAPPGWYTLSQIIAKLGVGRTAAQAILTERNAQKARYYRVTPDGRKVLQMHYKL
jgi:hypothetical protein